MHSVTAGVASKVRPQKWTKPNIPFTYPEIPRFKLSDFLDVLPSKGLTFKTHLTFWTEHQLLKPLHHDTKWKRTPILFQRVLVFCIIRPWNDCNETFKTEVASFKIFHYCVLVCWVIFCFEQLFPCSWRVNEEQCFILLAFFFPTR